MKKRSSVTFVLVLLVIFGLLISCSLKNRERGLNYELMKPDQSRPVQAGTPTATIDAHRYSQTPQQPQIKRRTRPEGEFETVSPKEYAGYKEGRKTAKGDKKSIYVTWDAFNKLEKRVDRNEFDISQLHGAIKELALRTYMFEEKFIPYYIGPFSTNSSRLTRELTEQLDMVVGVAAEVGLEFIAIYGFSDILGKEKTNKILSGDRAGAVAKYLSGKCISGKCVDMSTVKIEGRGEAQHLGYYVDNRSVVIVCKKNI